MEGMPAQNKIVQPPIMNINPEPSLENARPDDRTSAEIMGEDRFNRLQELGLKDLSDEERKEYLNLRSEFDAAFEISTRNSRELSDWNAHELEKIRQDLDRKFKQQEMGGTENLANDTQKIERWSSIDSEEISIEDKEKIKRLKYLNGLKGVLGSIDEDQEKELTALISWYDAKIFEILDKEANTPPSPTEVESPVEAFTEKDVLKWKEGTEKFKEFYKTLNIKEKSAKKVDSSLTNPLEINMFKTLFLGEKPVLLLDHDDIDLNNPDYSATASLLETFGIGKIGPYVYDKKQVKNVIEKNKDIFESYNSKDPDELMKLIVHENEGGAVKNDLAVGVLLGFPIESAKIFASYKEERNKGIKPPENQRGVNVYGNAWVDFGDSLESKIRQARLKAAFELSGILKI